MNLYFYTLNRFLLRVSLSIIVINAVINKYFEAVLGGMGNNSNTVIVYLFLHAGIKFFKGRIFFLLPLFL